MQFVNEIEVKQDEYNIYWVGIARAYQEYRNRIYAKNAILLSLTLLIDKPKTPFALTHTHIVAHIRATHSRS